MTGEKQQLLCPLLSLCMRQRKGGQRGKGRGREESELWEKVQGNAPKTNAMTHLTTRMKHGGGGGRGLWWGREEISTFSLNFKSKFLSRAKRWKKTLLCVGRFAGVKYKRWTAKPHQFKRERNMQSCPTTEAPSSGSISVRKQSTELAWNDELPWSTTERCWLFPGRDTCSCWQSTEVHSTFPLLQSTVFQRLWKNGWKWHDRNIHGDGRQSTRGDNLLQLIRRWRGAEVAALVVSLLKDNEHSDMYGSLFIPGAVSLLFLPWAVTTEGSSANDCQSDFRTSASSHVSSFPDNYEKR